ncbi:PAS domain-containing sensor histidine kinase [Chthoniobacter flavus]|uniref:PAS domain-containing sensor histidine kinase n=1 Tax=Chthoniobacter flavus TaxID=191863 RepID=UPI0002EBC269|nr:PAS domain S-box protein [Chthoniobacter flavus]
MAKKSDASGHPPREPRAVRKNSAPPATSRTEAEVQWEHFADLYNFAPVGFLTLNHHGQVLDLNLAASGLLRRSRQSIIGAPFALFLDRGHLDAFLEYLRRCDRGESQVVTDTAVRHPDGRVVPIRLVGAQIPFRTSGEHKLYQAALIDISEQVKLGRTLRDSEEHFRMALRCAHAGYWSIDFATRRTVWSPEFYTVLGVEPERVSPSETAFLDLLIVEDRLEAECALESVLSGETDHFEGEYRLRTSSREVRWLGIFGRITRSSGGTPLRIVGIGIDLTRQKQTAEDLRKSRKTLEQRVKQRTADLLAAKAVLEREVADRKQLERQILEISERERRRMGQDLHDGLGQQITGIIFHAHLLHKHLTTQGLPQAEMAGQIVELLNEAKIQARHIARGLQPVDPAPNGLMAGLDHFACTTSELYHIDCCFLCPEPVLIAEHTTSIHLFRIAQEAVANAFRHGGAQKIEIHLRETGDQLVLEIHDHGCGLPKLGRRREGLGMRFMKYRAETIGGAVDIRRRPGGGTMVRCRVRKPDGTSEAE